MADEPMRLSPSITYAQIASEVVGAYTSPMLNLGTCLLDVSVPAPTATVRQGRRARAGGGRVRRGGV